MKEKICSRTVGGRRGTRTLKSFQTQASETCAYTNSATRPTTVRGRVPAVQRGAEQAGTNSATRPLFDDIFCFDIPTGNVLEAVGRRLNFLKRNIFDF